MARVTPPSMGRSDDFGAFSIGPENSPGEDAEIVEGNAFDVFDVPFTDQTGFTHFMDGAERKWRVGFYGLHPIYLAHVSAGLLKREERTVLPPEEGRYSTGRLECFAPETAVAAATLAGLKCTPIKLEEGSTSAMVETQIRDAVQHAREHHEVNLAATFENGEGWLLIDGGIGWPLRVNARLAHAVGIVKTHSRQYVRSGASVNKLLNMRAGQRSALFRRPNDSRQGNEALSCYLKLRESSDQGPFYGLVRLEIPDLDEAKGRIDEIAGWVLAERTPLSLPDPRHDRLLYPIRLVETYLKALQPSPAAVLGFLG